jgi:hypothetical protein
MSYGGMIQCLAKQDHCILDTGAQKIVPESPVVLSKNRVCRYR